jgi:TRAP-type C4-dicarboxylate transport system permease small subunit
LKNGHAIYKKLLDIIIISIFLTMFSITVLNVFLRFIFNNPIPWGPELARYSFVWIVYLGAILAMREGSHIGLEFIEKKMSQGLKMPYRFLINILIIIFLSVLTFVGVDMALKSYNTYSSAMQMPMFIPYLALPVGGIGMLIECIIKLLFIIKQKQ